MEGVVKFSPRPASHRAHGRGSGRKVYSTTTSKKASPHPASHHAVGGGDGVLSKLLLVMRVDGTHQKYSGV